jgi:hypothetical protein
VLRSFSFYGIGFLGSSFMKTSEKSIVPPQEEGTKKDIEHTVKALDENGARKLFDIARNRLVDVNHWHRFSNPARFQLTDGRGNELSRTAETGDYFKINIHAPGPVEGRGFDWVYIEAIDDHSDPNGNTEQLAMRVRPARSPETPSDENVAHFFSDEATSSFVVKREGRKVTAAVYGRNEKPNTSTSNVIDKVRNAVVAVSAILGLGNVQWNSLVKGLLST